MKDINPILYKDTLKGEAAIVQKIARVRAFNKTKKCIEMYCAMEKSHGGLYINSDLFKEIFPEFSRNKETRKKFDLAVHNSSAWLAQKLFEGKIKDPSVKECIFLTGVPGAGKSFYIQSLFEEHKISDGTIIFEGSLCNLEAAIAKFKMLEERGIKIRIQIIHADPVLIYQNVLQRENENGRGATLATLAYITSELRGAVTKLNELFDISEIGLFSKVGNNDNVTLYEGEEAIKMLPICTRAEARATYEAIIAANEGMALK